jgi:hypothetical protein
MEISVSFLPILSWISKYLATHLPQFSQIITREKNNDYIFTFDKSQTILYKICLILRQDKLLEAKHLNLPLNYQYNPQYLQHRKPTLV